MLSENPERSGRPDDPTLMAHGLEELIVLALVRLEQDGRAGVQRLLADHPQHAAALSEHLERLQHLGLLKHATSNPDAPREQSARQFPEQLGDFRLLSSLGGGGMGVVYLAEQQSLARQVALKLIRSEHLFFPGARERFRREVEAVARLQHPGIVPVYATGEDDGVPWLAMEHIVGASLEEVLQELAGRDPSTLRGDQLQAVIAAIVRKRSRASSTVAYSSESVGSSASLFAGAWTAVCMRIVRSVAEALDHAHQRGVLHRDVKPSNVMLTVDARVLLLDFGLARTDDAVRMTRTGNLVGTPAYMSPEQTLGDVERIDARTDVYSLGVLLYELLSLRSPFAAATMEATRQMVLAGKVRSLRSVHASVPADVEIVCQKAMELDPERRYASVGAFARDLVNVLELRPIAAKAPSALRIVRRWAQRRPATAITIVAVFLIGCVAPTVFYLQQRVANSRIQEALGTAEADRDRAREALAIALRDRQRARAAVQTLLTRVANESLLDVPRLQQVRRDLLVSARDFHEQFLRDSGDDPSLLAESAETARALAVVESELGLTESAFAACARAVELSRRVLEQSPVTEASQRAPRRLALALATLGAALQSRGQLERSLAVLDESAGIYQALHAASPAVIENKVDAMGVQRSRAMVLVQLGRDELARQSYVDLLRIWGQIQTDFWAGEQPQVEGSATWDEALRHALGATADEVDFELRHGDADAASEALRRFAWIDREAVRELPDTAVIAMCKMEVSRSHLAARAGDGTARERHLHVALQLLDPLLEINPEYATVLRFQAAIYSTLSAAYNDADRQEAAVAASGESMQRLRRLMDLDPSVVENWASLAASYINLGSAQQQLGELELALTSFRASLPLLIKALADVPSSVTWRQHQFDATWYIAQVLGQLGQHQEQAETARSLAAMQVHDARTQRIAAGLLATAAMLVAADTTLDDAERTAQQSALEREAMARLQDAAQLGCTDFERVRDGVDFNDLRQHADFATILKQIEVNQQRATDDNK